MRHARRVIVAAVDFSTAATRALEWAADLAAARRAELRLVHAAGWAEAGEGAFELPPALAAELVAQARLQLAAAAGELHPHPHRVTWEAAVGPPAAVVLAEAARCHPELIVIGTRGQHGWRHPLLGTTAKRVMGRAPCPVLAVHPADAPPPTTPWRVLAATDFSADAGQAARAALRLLGDRTGELVLLHALAAPRVDLSPGAVLSSPAARELLEAARSRALSQLAVDADDLLAAGVAVRTELVEGRTPQAIVEAVEQLAADVVTMGGRGQGGIEQLLLGSNVERVAKHARRPLLVLPRRAWVEDGAPAAAAAVGEEAETGD